MRLSSSLSFKSILNQRSEVRDQRSECLVVTPRGSPDFTDLRLLVSDLSHQFRQPTAFAEQFPLNNVPLNFRWSFHNPPGPRVAKCSRNNVALAKRRRPHNFQSKIENIVK